MSGIDEVSIKLGSHEAKLEAIIESQRVIAADVRCLVQEKNERNGSRRTLLAAATGLGGLAGAIGSAIASVLHR